LQEKQVTAFLEFTAGLDTDALLVRDIFLSNGLSTPCCLYQQPIRMW